MFLAFLVCGLPLAARATTFAELPTAVRAASLDTLIVSQQAKLTASDGIANDDFGQSAALSSDGSTALIRADNKTVSGNEYQGAAYVFVRSGTTWTQQAELTASDGASGDTFGWSAALSSDGNTALVGASNKWVSGNDGSGAVYVFVRSGTTWTQQAELTASDLTIFDTFGWFVALSSDSNTAFIGTGQGAAYVVVRSGTTWTPQAELTGGVVVSSGALSSDGNTMLVGADNTTVSGNEYQGAAYVFVRSGTIWTQQAELTASDGAANDYFGSSAALSSDSNTAFIETGQGAAYVFVRSGTTWTQQAELTGAVVWSAALNSNGNTALVGARGETVGSDEYQGATYVFVLLTPTPTPSTRPTGTPTPTQTVPPTPTPKPCVGDCNGNGQVTVDEILTMVNIALGNAPVTACEAGDANHDGQITVDEILTAVNNALNGCGG